VLDKAASTVAGAFMAGDRDLLSFCAILVITFIMGWGLYVLQPILGPFFFAVFFACLLRPVQRFLEAELSLYNVCCWWKDIRYWRRCSGIFKNQFPDDDFYRQMNERGQFAQSLQDDMLRPAVESLPREKFATTISEGMRSSLSSPGSAGKTSAAGARLLEGDMQWNAADAAAQSNAILEGYARHGDPTYPSSAKRKCIHRTCRMPHWLAVTLTFFFSLGMLALLSFLVVQQVLEILQIESQLSQQFTLLVNWTSIQIEETFTVPSDVIKSRLTRYEGDATNFGESLALSVIGTLLWNGGIVLLFMLFLLYGNGDPRKRKVEKANEDKRKIEGRGGEGQEDEDPEEGQVGRDMYHTVQAYLQLKSIISFMLGFMVWLILFCINVPGSLLFGLITFLANFVPMIGAIGASFLPLPLLILDPFIGGQHPTALASFGDKVLCECTYASGAHHNINGSCPHPFPLCECDSCGAIGDRIRLGILAMVLPIFVHGCVGNLLEPAVFGTKLELHPVVVLAMVLLGFTMWGLAGMILFVPIVAVLRIVLAHSKHRFARMMLDVLVKGKFSRIKSH